MKKYIAAILLTGALALSTPLLAPTTAYALSSDPACKASESAPFGIVPWYRNLLHKTGGSCEVQLPNASSSGNKTTASVTAFITTIVLNLIQAGLVIAAYVTVFFIIKGGFGYITSTGSPDGMSNAKKTITNAIIGLIIAVLAAAIVNAIAGVIK